MVKAMTMLHRCPAAVPVGPLGGTHSAHIFASRGTANQICPNPTK